MFFLTVDDFKHVSLNWVTFTQKKLSDGVFVNLTLKFFHKIIVYLLTKNKLLMTPRGSFISYIRKFIWKINISYPLIRIRACAYEGLRNVSFSEYFAYVLNERSKWKSNKNENLKFFQTKEC